MRVDDGEYLEGIRFLGDNGEILAENTWNIRPKGEWVTKEIPDGQAIIGIKCRTYALYHIRRLAFVLWVPDL